MDKDEILNIRWNNKDKYVEFECNNTTCHYDLENIKKAIETSWKLQSQIDEVKKCVKELYEMSNWIAIKEILSKLEEVGK